MHPRPAVIAAACVVLPVACGGGESGPPGGPDAGRLSVPVVPVGADAYRMWHRLPYLRVGTRTYMRSTYDRAGGNEGADASHFLRQEADDFNVTLDVAGPGVLTFVRTNHWHGSPWHYVVDGVDGTVSESSTSDPENPIEGSVFIPEAAFPRPLAVTWSVTKGADLSWVPVPFTRSFTLAYGRTHYGTGYYVYQLFPEGAENLSRPVTSFAGEAPDPEAVALLSRAGEDIAPNGETSESLSGSMDVPASGAAEIATLPGAQMLRAFSLRIPKAEAGAAASARLRITWDGRPEPSVDAPLTMFFGTGSFYDRDDKEWLVKGLLFSVRAGSEDLELATYFPMPFFSEARIELVAGAVPLTNVRWALRSEPYTDPTNWVGYFHATYRDHRDPALGQDLVILDTRDVEGGGDFCGSFNGMTWIFSDRGFLPTLEGDPRFFFDDAESPQAYGTGTEEWGGGGDYWGGQTMTLPLAGHPVGAPSPLVAETPEDLVESAYRVLVADAMPFGKNARIQLEHGALNDSTEHYQSVAYWYGLPGSCLELTDSLHVGDATDEAEHDYLSETASDVETITSRYELGIDTLGGVEIYPESTDTGRRMTGTSEMTFRIAAENHGVLLRRKLDYALPDQRAEVFVADDRPGAPFERAGIWYLAGSNTSVYSNPPGELDPPLPIVQTSNRRFRDDEFLVGPNLTAGRDRIRVRIVFSPENRPLMPGLPLGERAWSEIRYSAYVFRLPEAR